MDASLYQLKIAAAISIIRSKPAGIGACQYTEQLCAKYIQQQSHWRTRYFQVQDALVHLRQQQVIQTTQLHGSKNAEDENICLPTPPLSAPETGASGDSILHANGTQEPAVTADHLLTSSFQFIQSVVSLARALQIDSENTDVPNKYATDKGDGQSQTSSSQYHLHPSQLSSLMAETVPVCVRHLQQIVKDGKTSTSTCCVMQGLEALVLLVNTDWSELMGGVHYQRFLLEKLGGLVDSLLHQLFESESTHQRSSKQLLHAMLCRVTTKLRTPEKYSILQSIATHSQTLCQKLTHTTSSNDTKTDGSTTYECYERLGIALDCLLKGAGSIKLKELHAECLQELQKEAESMLGSKVIQNLPLVAHTLFRLTSVLEHLSQCGSPE